MTMASGETASETTTEEDQKYGCGTAGL